MTIGTKRIFGVFAVALVAGIVSVASTVRADSFSAQLINVGAYQTGAAGEVGVSGTAIPEYSGAAYAGVLDWHVRTSPSDTATNITNYSYCIDVASVISFNGVYNFTTAPGNLSDAFPIAKFSNSSQIVSGIENLWSNNPLQAYGTVDTQADVQAISNEHAGEFQVALWDIIYNQGSTTLTGNPLNFANLNIGLVGTDLQDALNAAHSAYTAAPPASTPVLQAWIATDGSQNQAIYLAGPPQNAPLPTPLPDSFKAGLYLLALFGAIRFGRWGVGRAARQ